MYFKYGGYMLYLQEVTVWNAGYTVPNHVYYVDTGKSKLVGYIPAGKKRLVKFSKPLPFDTRGRKFQTLDKKGEADTVYFQKTEPTRSSTAVDVAGSGGKKYYLTKYAGKWVCTCPGYTFRRTCKHSTAGGA